MNALSDRLRYAVSVIKRCSPRAQSDTLGVVALVTIVLVIAAVVAIFVFADISGSDDDPVFVSIDIDTTDDEFVVVHGGGATLDPADVTLLIEGEGERESLSLAEVTTPGDDRFSAADRVRHENTLDTASVTAFVIYDPTNTVLAEKTVSPAPGNGGENGGDENGEDGTATFEFVETEFALVDETIDVAYELTNTGEVNGTQDVVFSVDDTDSESTETTLEPGQNQAGSFSYELGSGHHVSVAVRTANETVSETLSVETDRLAYATASQVVLYDIEAERGVTTLDETGSSISEVVSDSGGEYLAYGAADGTVYVHSTADWSLERTLTDPTADVEAVSLAPDGELLAVGSDDGQVYLYETHSWSLVDSFADYDDGLRSVTFSPDGEYLAGGTTNESVFVHSISTGERVATFAEPQNDVKDVAFSPDGTQLVASELAGGIQLYETDDWSHDQTVGEAGGLSVSFSPDGSQLLSSAGAPANKSLPVYDTTDWTRTVELGDEPVLATAWTGDGEYVAGGFVDGVTVFRTDAWEPVTTLEATLVRDVELLQVD